MVGDPFAGVTLTTHGLDEEYLRNYYVTVPSVAYFASPPPRETRKGDTEGKWCLVTS